MKKQFKYFATLLGFIFYCLSMSGQEAPALKLRYDFPASAWETEALPIGNGFLGAMVFGDVPTDVIQINEHSLWSGGPGKNPNYNGGHLRTPAVVQQSLQDIRTSLQTKMTNFTANDAAYMDGTGKVIAKNYPAETTKEREYINNLMGTKNDFGSYQSLSNLNIACNVTDFPPYTQYVRELDIDRSVMIVSYTQESVNYTREYFISHPDNVLVVRLTADQPGKLSRNIWLTTPQTGANLSAANGTITLEGKPADHTANGLKFAQQVKIIPSGGSSSVSDNKIVVENADEILIISSAATNYQQCMDNTFNYFSEANPLTKVQETITAATQKTYTQLLNNHLNDYQSLFGRMQLSLTSAENTNNKTTKQLLDGYKANTNTAAENLYLEQLYYQFGRYLLISSSRENGLPANLQGIWAEGLAPPWNADYHTNINIQMNYWLAEQTNLAECHLPVMDYVRSLVPRGKITANHYYVQPNGNPVRGWVIHHENNIWGNTAPGNWYEGFHFPAAAAWMCQDIWEYYQFNQNEAFLNEYYPILLDAALFWVDNLWRDTRDGTLVANSSYSPEHGPYSLGASCDQAIITELFDMIIKAAAILNKNTSEIDEIIVAKSRLAGPQIGLAGQFMEWKDELQMDITGDGGHRHVNHLFWLHPGSQIIPGRNAQEDLYTEAMKKTLNTRGDGGTGWSKAWKINFWARLRDGNHSHKLLQELLKESTLTNLFDTHPPFQIDGNFGASAGMTEMLVQSQGEYIELLPALPDNWASGNFKGVKARGNFELTADWENKHLNRLEIRSNSGKVCKLKYAGIKNFSIIKQGGGSITPTIIDDNTIEFETNTGAVYTLTN
jgi:alpha-L-fucosidase 2